MDSVLSGKLPFCDFSLHFGACYRLLVGLILLGRVATLVHYLFGAFQSRPRLQPKVFMLELRGHAVAEAPSGVACALLYIVRASPSFLLPPSYKLFYHTFHHFV